MLFLIFMIIGSIQTFTFFIIIDRGPWPLNVSRKWISLHPLVTTNFFHCFFLIAYWSRFRCFQRRNLHITEKNDFFQNSNRNPLADFEVDVQQKYCKMSITSERLCLDHINVLPTDRNMRILNPLNHVYPLLPLTIVA